MSPGGKSGLLSIGVSGPGVEEFFWNGIIVKYNQLKDVYTLVVYEYWLSMVIDSAVN